MKVSDVKAPSKPKALKCIGNSWDSMDSIDDAMAEQEFYLLTKCEGYDFRNRLVPAERIKDEFHHDAVVDAAALAV